MSVDAGRPPSRWTDDYEIIMASDIIADGMWLEAHDRGSPRELVLTVFYSDVDGSSRLEQHRDDLPAEFVDWFRAEAARRLPPHPDESAG